jgi:hypothetical protein
LSEIQATAAIPGVVYQKWMQQQEQIAEQSRIRAAQNYGAQFPNSETQPPNAVPPPDRPLRVVNQVDRSTVLLNVESREEARLLAESMQNRVREAMRNMEASSAIFDSQKYVETPEYDVGQYFDKEA